MTDAVDNNADMPDALEVAAKQDAYFKSTGKLIGPLHGIVFSIKDWYDTFDMRIDRRARTSRMPTTVRRTTPPSSRACARRAESSWRRPTWDRRTSGRGVHSAA